MGSRKGYRRRGGAEDVGGGVFELDDKTILQVVEWWW